MGSAMKFLWWMVVARKVGWLYAYGNHCWKNFELMMAFFLWPTLPNLPRALPFFRESPAIFGYDPDRNGAPLVRSTLSKP
jgi:hypothetical protein